MLKLNEKINLLIVDDEPNAGDALKRYLSVRQYEVIVAYSGEEALKILEKQKIDLVLLDIIMHGINGITVAKIIKEKYPNVKIMVLTAFPEAASRISSEVVLEGCYIKPHGVEDIYKKLQNLC